MAVCRTQHVSQNSPAPTREMLLDLSPFWEILEYCAMGARPGSAQVLAPELAAHPDMPNDEESHTSPLPDNSRLYDYKIRDQRRYNDGSVSITFQAREMENTHTERSLPRGDECNDLRGFMEDDEMAALADTFFGIGNHSLV